MRKRIFFLTLLLIICAIAGANIWHNATTLAKNQSEAPPLKTEPTREAQTGCCGQNGGEDKPHLLAASYYSVRNNLNARLMLNNKGPKPIEVTPTLFSLSGQRLDAAPVIVEGESFSNFDLRDFGALPGTAFEEGSIQLFHRGFDLVIGAQLYMEDVEHGLSFDEKLAEFQTFPSNRLQSVWWLPSREAEAHLMLSNTGDSALTVNADIIMGTPRAVAMEFTLGPHETRIVNVQPRELGEGANQKPEVGSASIRHSGAKGALLARTLIWDTATGYSWSAQFADPQGAKSSAYQGVGLRVTDVAGERLTPIIVAHNNSDSTSILTGRMPYTAVDGSMGVIELPKIRLNPNGVTSVNLEHAIKSRVRGRKIASAGLEFEYTGAPGSVQMATQSVSASRNQVFRVPMWDVPAQRNGSGGYPWYIDGSSSTVVYIKNVTDQPQNYTFNMTYEDDGIYALGVKRVEPHQAVTLDLRLLRDEQVPDERGRTIPLTASRGKLVWSVRGPNSLALLGRSEQVDVEKGMSSSYACFMCCPNSFLNSWLEPGSFSVIVGSSSGLIGVEQDRNCYGSALPPYYWGGLWFSDNEDMVTMSAGSNYYSATANVINYGDGFIWGEWSVYDYTATTENIAPECRVYEYMTTPMAPVITIGLPKILSIEQQIVNESSQGGEVVECGVFKVISEYQVGCPLGPGQGHTYDLIGNIVQDAILLDTQIQEISNDNETCGYRNTKTYRMKNRLSQSIGSAFTSYRGRLEWSGKTAFKNGPGISVRATMSGTGPCP